MSTFLLITAEFMALVAFLLVWFFGVIVIAIPFIRGENDLLIKLMGVLLVLCLPFSFIVGVWFLTMLGVRPESAGTNRVGQLKYVWLTINRPELMHKFTYPDGSSLLPDPNNLRQRYQLLSDVLAIEEKFLNVDGMEDMFLDLKEVVEIQKNNNIFAMYRQALEEKDF